MHTSSNQLYGPSRWGWALLLFIVVTAVFLRFYQLGHVPPGLYRDEAANGLDALTVLHGRFPLFFPANNGREPAYIYLTAAAIAVLGRSATAVRLAAAVVGALTTLVVFGLGRAWFGQRVGLLAAWLWAVTVWSVHLSRIGLRVVLMVPLLVLAFWLGTLAYRRQKWWLWLTAGLVYGAGFYTYLAMRFTPLLLLALLAYLLWQRQGARLWPGAAWFALGTAVALLPLGTLFLQDPALILGRTGQVSVLNTAVNGGDLWGTLVRQIGRALGMFLWRGDDILRHNPAGRPVF
ncbi:MAG: glycosyltransferase family 39 protein, partial [Anaerolineales bacterium]|nr:glycosyltransferase family 39 protein [Anaerolineales bacterium]